MVRVAVVGGGIAGLEFIRHANFAEITLIEPKDRMVCQALLPEYLSEKVLEEDISINIADFCDRFGVNLVRDYAIKVENDRIITKNGEVEFDFAVIATGAKPNVFENTYSVGDLESTEKTKKALENAEEVVVIGSGATGVEVACEVREFYGCNVRILEYFDRILPSFSCKVSNFVEKVVRGDGISITTSCKVLGVNESIATDKGKINADVVISCAGLKPNPIEGVKTQKGWIIVDEFLRAKNNVFAIGDCALVKINDKIATKTALEAERQALYTARNIKRLSKGEKPIPYKVKSSIDSPISFITLAKNRAVLVYNRLFIPKPMKLLYKIKKSIVKSFMKRLQSD
jgi:NADH dehydrogenase